MRIALGVEYDGSDFRGWQTQQRGVRTVQACLEKALSRVADGDVQVFCAGRTDAGVHAVGQVAHFDTDARRSPRSWVLGGNSHLPADVSLSWAQPVAGTFHARFSALARCYRYLILNRAFRSALWRRRAAWCHRPLRAEPMREAASYLLGEHDFSSFKAAECQSKSPVRTINRLEIRARGQNIVIDVEANAFLHHMVRNIAGVLMAVGTGTRPPEWAREVLERRDRTLAGVTAPPQGLYLLGVRYPAEYRLPPAEAVSASVDGFG